MARGVERKAETNRAAIYARVSDKSQAEEDKISLSEQTIDMEAYCERRGLTIVARYQEVGRGWSKKRPEFQRMLADAREGRFDTIVCWKSDRLSRGMYPAAALMEVVEAYQTRLEAVMDTIDMKTFGLMAAIGKIELDNFRERASMGKRGKAKQGRMPNGSIPYGYRIGEDGKPVVYEPEAEIVKRIFRQYVHEGMVGLAIARQLAQDNAPTWRPGSRWHNAYVCALLGKEVYKGTWWYGKARWVATEGGDQRVQAAGGCVDRDSLPTAGGRADLGQGAGHQEAEDLAIQAEHQDLLPAAAPPQVRRMRAALRLPVEDSCDSEAQGQDVQLQLQFSSTALSLLRHAEGAPAVPGTAIHQSRQIGGTGLERGQEGGPES